MIDLERELVALGAALDAPTDPQLVMRVRQAIAEPSPSRLRRRLLVIAAIVLGGTGVVAAAPVVADWLGVGGVEVKLGPPPTTITPADDSGLDLGQRTTLAQASRRVGFDIVVPAELGAPDEVWLDGATNVPVVWLAYRPRAGLPEAAATGYGALLAQSNHKIFEDAWASKFAEPDTKIEAVNLGTGRALWVQGTHHVGFRSSSGFTVDRLRLSDNVLLWERGDVTMRLESALGRDDSLAIGRSVP